MISQLQIQSIVRKYNQKEITIGVLGGHSALDVCQGAKKYGFKTLVVCQKGREKTYDTYYKTRGKKGIVDETIILNKFSDIILPKVQEKLIKLNTIFIHNRYFWVYFNFSDIENNFNIPIYGTRELVKLEERDVANNQYFLLEKAEIRMPKQLSDPKKIKCLVIVKVNEAQRKYERSFFFASSYQEYLKKSQELIRNKTINKNDLQKAVIEEYVIGAHINLNFFYSPLSNELELMGTDTRRQTNLDGFLRLPANEQLEVLKYSKPKLIETGHYSVTMKESLLEKAFLIGEKFVDATKKYASPGIIGPFALQGAVVCDQGKEDFVIFDVSMRIPGSPGTAFTPYSGYLYHQSISYGERIAMEITKAIKEKSLGKIVS